MLIFETYSDIQRARRLLLMLSTRPEAPNDPEGYTKACPNDADAVCVSRAHAILADIIETCAICAHSRCLHHPQDARCPTTGKDGVPTAYHFTTFKSKA